MTLKGETLCCIKYCSCLCSINRNSTSYLYNKKLFYIRATWHLYHALWTRTWLIIIATIADYIYINKKYKAAEIVYLVCTVISTVLLIYAVLGLINLCKLYYYVYICML